MDRVRGALSQLFHGDDEPHLSSDDTEEIPVLDPRMVGGTLVGPVPSHHDLQIGIASDPGRVRDHNQDASLAWLFQMAHRGQSPRHVGLFIVADGMGGHSRGDLASDLALRQSAEYVIRHVSLPFLSADQDGAGRVPIHDILGTSVRVAHEAVLSQLPEAGTTLTIALVVDGGVYIAHVGDSRAYLGQRGSLEPLTHDHSVAARLVEMGQATPEEVAFQRNILYKAVGQGAEIAPDIVYHDLDWGQYLLLCCDGLWGKVPDEEMAATVEAAATPDVACQNLVGLANHNGGEDNISVVLAARGWPLPLRVPPE